MARLSTGLIFLACLLLGFSLLGHPGVTSPPPGLTLALGGGLGVACGLTLLFGLQITTRSAAALSVCQIVLVVVWLSSQTSLDKFLSQVGLCSWISGLGLLSSLVVGVRARSDWRKVAGLMIALSFLSTSYGLVLALSHDMILRANFTNADCFSVIPLTGALLGLGLLPGAEKRTRLLLTGCLATLAAGLFLTSSRSGLLGYLVGLAVFATLAWKKDRARQALLVTISAPLIAGLLLLSLGKSGQLLEKWTSLTTGSDRLSYQVRLAVLRGGLQASFQRPLLGFGPGVFHLAYQPFRGPLEKGEDYMNEAHDDFVQILVELGYPGLTLWLFLLLLAVLQAVRNCRSLNSVEHAGALSAASGILVYSLGNFAIPLPVDFFFLCATLGLCLASRLDNSCPRLIRWGLASGLLIFGLTSVGQGIMIWRNNESLEVAARMGSDLRWEEAYGGLESSVSSGDMRILLERANIAEQLSLFQGDPSWLDGAVQELADSDKFCQVDLRVLLRLSALYEGQGKYREALATLRRAEAQSKHSLLIERAIARNLILQGDLLGAAQQLLLISPEEDAQALGQLLALLEGKQAGMGLKLLTEWGEAKPGRALGEAARSAGQAAQKLGHPQLALIFYEHLLQSKPDDGPALLACISLESEPAQKLALANRALNSTADEDTHNQALREWVRLKLGPNSHDASTATPEVLMKLESYLAKHPGVSDLRVTLSDLYEAQNRTTEARRTLREGLDLDRNGAIHARLGALYEHNGSPDIAASYYEEALRLQPGNESLKKLIEKLQAPKVNFEDPTLLKTRVHASSPP